MLSQPVSRVTCACALRTDAVQKLGPCVQVSTSTSVSFSQCFSSATPVLPLFLCDSFGQWGQWSLRFTAAWNRPVGETVTVANVKGTGWRSVFSAQFFHTSLDHWGRTVVSLYLGTFFFFLLPRKAALLEGRMWNIPRALLFCCEYILFPNLNIKLNPHSPLGLPFECMRSKVNFARGTLDYLHVHQDPSRHFHQHKNHKFSPNSSFWIFNGHIKIQITADSITSFL